MIAKVVYRDSEPNGLATMLGGLMEANLSQHPRRADLLRDGTVAITATDIGASVTFRLRPEEVTVANGVIGRPMIHVEADSGTLVGLSSVPTKWGIPDATSDQGKEMIRKLRSGELKIRGAVTHPLLIGRFAQLLAVS